jgi:hypothetical protein
MSRVIAQSQNDPGTWAAAAKPVRSSATRFHFNELGALRLGRGPERMLRLIVRLSQKTLMTHPIDADRANGWQIGTLDIRLTGQTDPHPDSTRF